MAQISLSTVNKIKLSLDVITGISTLVLLSPPLTGIPVHEWLGLAVCVPLLFHLLINWLWICTTTRCFFRKLPWQTRINYILNALFFMLMTAEGFTGLMISKEILPLFGLSASRNYFYRALHSMLADSLLVVFGLHLGMNWKWVAAVIRKHVFAPFIGNRSTSKNTASPSMPSVKAE
ncbi:MAG: DUF4405 domain-containing protein [Chloroflexi bacterium]|nr:DUF4405 domain-containing protein [Chloroflexota bacterium]